MRRSASRWWAHYNPLSKRQLNVLPVGCGAQVCDECLKTDHPEKCRHKLASMPRWLSSQKVEVVRKLLSEVRTQITLLD